MSHGPWMTIREAWQLALYGPSGFYVLQQPRDHFRTSVHASPLFAEALLSYVRRLDLAAVTDIGSGDGELLAELHALAPDVSLLGVDLRARPADLDPAIGWQQLEAADAETVLNDVIGASPGEALVLANEVLDNVPCDVAELDQHGTHHLVEVNVDTGYCRMGAQVSAHDSAWLARWWPLNQPGQRAEIGLPRESFWGQVCSAAGDRFCVAIDYGHLRETRPRVETLASYRTGHEGPATFDGHHDVTAHVAVDAVADVVGARLTRQSDMLRNLGLSGSRPELALASSEPASYLRALARASQAAELTASPGLGDFWWIVTPGQQSMANTPGGTSHP